MSEVSERASERVSAAERASEASSAEQVNDWAVQANERTDERVAQYYNLYSWLFWPTVHSRIVARVVGIDHWSRAAKKESR